VAALAETLLTPELAEDEFTPVLFGELVSGNLKLSVLAGMVDVSR
jgi:hypothetical protein